jgi:hypothetical protein
MIALEEVFNDPVKPLNNSPWPTAMIGHSEQGFTARVAIEAETDLQKGTDRMLEAAVQ